MFASVAANKRALVTVEKLDEYAYRIDNAFYIHLLEENGIHTTKKGKGND